MSELLKINVNDHVEKKNGLSYLSWAWAWSEVLKLDPTAQWMAHEYPEGAGLVPCMYLRDGSAMVKVTVIIKGVSQTCTLPVMDHRNKAIKEPDAFAINTAIVRCLTKAIALHGLGLYIYAGEDLPPIDTESLDAFAAELVQLHNEQNDVEACRQWYASDMVQTSNDAREYMWSQLRDYSALRSAIKANKPEPKKAA